MPRFIDEIRACKHWVDLVEPVEYWPSMTAYCHQQLANPQLPVLLLDNVAAYLSALLPHTEGRLRPEHDFPNLAPPFQEFWAEHQMLRGGESFGSRVGVFVTARDLRREPMPAPPTGERPPADGTVWVLSLFLFAENLLQGRMGRGPVYANYFDISAEGKVLGIKGGALTRLAESRRSEMHAMMSPTLLAISFLHCKNVTLIKNEVPPALAKKQARRLGKHPTAYHTLVIEPLKNILQHEGQSGQHGLAKALHLCRGHFRDYREGAGLFGKYKVMVWQPMIVRGGKKTEKEEPPAREIRVKV